MFKKIRLLFVVMFVSGTFSSAFAQIDRGGEIPQEYWYFDGDEIRTDNNVFIRGYLRMGDYIDAPDIRLGGIPIVSSQWINNGNNIFFNSGDVEIGKKLTLKSTGNNLLTIETASISPFDYSGIKFKGNGYESELRFHGGQYGYLDYNQSFRILSNNGFVGIGINHSPQYELDVNGTINAAQIYKNGAPLKESKWNSTGNNIYYNNGNVGIGAVPLTRLHLNNGVFRLSTSGIEEGGIINNEVDNTDDLGANYDITPTGNYLNISNSIYVKPNGNVGIGTSNPGYKFTVNGIINATEIYKNGAPLSTGQWSSNGNNVYYNNGNIGIGTDIPKAKLHVTHDIALGNDVNNQKFILHSRHNASNGDFIQLTCDDASGEWDWSKGLTFVRSTGNVGIGTTNPSQKFTVNGTILSKEVLVSTSSTNWPDYVFEKEYNLMSLEELETFVDSKKHLPGIPTSVDVEKNGVQVGEMVSNLLKKVEELTLYVIEQNKHIKKLENEIDQLK